MPTVDYVFVDPSSIQHEICVISDTEWKRREEESHRWESDGRSARREISVYDAMMEEIHADKAIRAEKFRKTHDICKKSKDETPADRKRNKIRRLRKLYGNVWEDGTEWFYESGKTGSKKTTEKCAEIVRNIRESVAESDARRDYLTEPVERKVGYNTVERIMYNADKAMREIRAKVANPEGKCDDTTVETYDTTFVVKSPYGENRYAYPNEYYIQKATWDYLEYLVRTYGMEYANREARGV